MIKIFMKLSYKKKQYGKCIHAKNILWLLFIFIMVYNIDSCWISSLEDLINGYNYLPHRQFIFSKEIIFIQYKSI